MTALAGCLQARGYRVTGSDENVYPPMSEHLAALGIALRPGYCAENIPADVDLVVVGNVIRASNPEAEAMRARGLPFMSMAEAVRRFAIGERRSVVIAGTHGKTTTTSLCAHVLVELGADPGFLIGGIARNFGTNFRLGGGDVFVIEGDEYDTAYFDKTPKFFKYQAHSLLFTSLEFDHADIYPDLAAITTQFAALIRGLPRDGLLVACADDPNAAALTSLAPCPVVTYGTAVEADCRIESWRAEGPGARFETHWQGVRHSWHVPLAGVYNARNAAAVIVLAQRRGATSQRIQAALDAFQGVKRRQEVRGEAGGVTVVDDFAHHPTAVRLTIEAIRARYPGRRLWAVFEPRSFTARSAHFQAEFPAALAGAERVLVAPAFHGTSAAGAALDTRAVAEALNRAGTPALAAGGTDEILDVLSAEAVPGDVVLVMSNGGFDNIHARLLQRLASAPDPAASGRAPAEPAP
ncbi:MAG: UDP-N-acetylmuramate:L-alanyl-gamma-D-glutamyl-meso-diaminopimelate ligase [Candidatus Lambdaproteobacteria bacterium]|nr:UDP-N-acetylmuramate:L-alanyl-gamma-D-glutamyl-meso-diaminopimelate ligase [Candidatus Lambdaproteobacteria bacterium]